ncbi:MAG TPA: hypothetical protein VH640_03245 [Bryobacteraceae bacterium]|jgi:hypothetical protein
MTENEQNYLNRGTREQDLTGIPQPENRADVPAPFTESDMDPAQDQTMSDLDEALQAATEGGELVAVDDPYDGESDAPGEPS